MMSFSTGKIGHSDHADGPAQSIYHWKPTELRYLHQMFYLRNAMFLPHANNLARHNSLNEFIVEPGAPRQGGHTDIAIRDNPHNYAVFIDNRQPATILFPHDVGRLSEAVKRRRAVRLAVHP